MSAVVPSRPYRALAADWARAEAAMNVREVGANNRGPRVEWYQRFDSLPGEGYAWCNSFVDAAFAAVGRPLDELLRSAGVSLTEAKAREKRWLTASPDYGCLVTFKFSHIGIYLWDDPDDPNYIITVEGNTGPTGAVSDSRSGGDGVYVKRRHKSLVSLYICVPGERPARSMTHDVERKARQLCEARACAKQLAHVKTLRGYWSWLAWSLGEGPFKPWGPRSSEARPNVPRVIPPTWWARRAAFITNRKAGQ